MGEKKNGVSHEEIWDDSALIDSWNDALEEYKKYHSIHAKGGTMKDIKKASDSRSIPTDQTTEESATGVDELENAEHPEGETDVAGNADPADHVQPSEMPGPPGFPAQAVLGSIRDENLKKLLMSWYYAGYYTGLFEGQQQAQQPQT